MNRSSRKRLKNVTQRIETTPILPMVEDAAFQRFRETGELPNYQRLAGVVIECALRGGASRGSWIVMDMRAALVELVEIANRPDDAEPEPEPLRKILFHEAVYGLEPVRTAARQALKMLVAIGRDVIDPEFIPSDTERPEFGTCTKDPDRDLAAIGAQDLAETSCLHAGIIGAGNVDFVVLPETRPPLVRLRSR